MYSTKYQHIIEVNVPPTVQKLRWKVVGYFSKTTVWKITYINGYTLLKKLQQYSQLVEYTLNTWRQGRISLWCCKFCFTMFRVIFKAPLIRAFTPNFLSENPKGRQEYEHLSNSNLLTYCNIVTIFNYM